jgi:hypothetical protein
LEPSLNDVYEDKKTDPGLDLFLYKAITQVPIGDFGP